MSTYNMQSNDDDMNGWQASTPISNFLPGSLPGAISTTNPTPQFTPTPTRKQQTPSHNIQLNNDDMNGPDWQAGALIPNTLPGPIPDAFFTTQTSQSTPLPPILIENVWSNGTNNEDIIEDDLMQESEKQTVQTEDAQDTPVVESRKHQHDDDNEPEETLPQKQIAISGPNQLTLDDMRGREEISRQKALEKSVLIKQQVAKLQKTQAELDSLHQQRLKDAETETQMAEQILQSEQNIATLMEQNRQYLALIQESHRKLEAQTKEMQDDRHQREAMTESLQKIQEDYACDKASHTNEILALRQRIQESSARGANLPNTPLFAGPRTRTHNTFLRSSGASVGVVPLRPVVTPSPNTRAGASSEPGNSPASGATGQDFGDINNLTSLQAVVKETLRQMNVTQVVVTKPGSKRMSSSRTQNRRILEAQKQKMSKADDLAWKELVRLAWKSHFQVSSVNEFSQYIPEPIKAVEDFETGRDGPGEKSKLDFNKGFEKSRWNKVILQRLYNQLLVDREADGTWNVPDVPEPYIMALFYGQLKRSREAWSLVQQRPNLQEGRMETRNDVATRVTEYTDERMAAVGSRSRCEQKFQRRQKTVERVIALKTESHAPDLAAWQHFRDLLEKLSANCMSEEEEGVEKLGEITVPVFRVRLCPWRNPILIEYFKYIDKESQCLAIRGKQGSKLQPRIYTDEPGKASAPGQLPCSLYSVDWLARQEENRGKEWIEQELKVSQEVFEMLEFTATL